MRDRWLAAAAWVAFVVGVAATAYVSLTACDLGGRHLFGLRYCKVEAPPDRLAAEREREQNLRDLIHRAELRVARLPVCAPPAPLRPPPQREAAVDPPKPPDPPPPRPPEPPQPPRPVQEPAAPPEEMKVPRTLAELEGCWQSVRGDIPMVSDDAEKRPLGKVRICYCFTGRSQGGSARYLYTEGGRCVGPLRVQLAQDKLSFDHGRINCTHNRGYVVPSDIVCKNSTGGEPASCDTFHRGQVPTSMKDEKFQRVSAAHCE